jgi:nucleotide-binding universal stress UspA family protein
MKKFEIKKILIPIDFSETSKLAISHGAFMAKLFKAELILLHIVEKNWNPFDIVVPEVKIEPPSDLAQKIQEKLDELAEKTRSEYGVVIKTISTTGSVCDEVVGVAKENGADIIIMGTHGASGFEELFVGSNTYKVVTLSEVPVLSVQTNAKNIGFRNIVLPIDMSEYSRQKVNHAVVLAKHYACKVSVLGLLDNEGEVSEENKFRMKIDQVNSYLEKSGVVHSSEIKKGKNQAKLTMEYADSLNADLIVIMTDQEENGSFLSSFAQQVVNHSKIPVMSIHPEEHGENIPWVHPY